MDIFSARRRDLFSTTSVTVYSPEPEPEPEIAQNIFDHDSVILSGNNEPSVPITCGVVFNAITQGEIRAISFYKSAGDVATSRDVGLYSDAGVLLASGTSSDEVSGPGWVSVSLDNAYTVDALVQYIAAVHYPSGSYPFQSSVFTSPVVRGDLIAESQAAAPGNGRFTYGATLANPTTSASQASFGVDVDFFPDPFPTLNSTGVPSGTELTPQTGAVHLLTDGQILEDKDISGFVMIHAENCIIRRCRIRNEDGGVVGCIRVDTNDSTGAGLLVEDCTIDGTNVTTNGIMAEGTFIGNRITGVDNGVNVYGPSTIKGNYIYLDLSSSPDPHFDGIEMNAGQNIEIRHNTIIINQGQTSAIMMNNEFGSLENIDIVDNYLAGGGYTIYCDDGKSLAPENAVDEATINIHYNKMISGLFGYFALYTSGVVPTNNWDKVTGDPI